MATVQHAVLTSESPPDGGDEQQWAACLVAKTGNTFFRRNSPEPDQARESFLLKNDIALFSRPAGLRPPTSPHSRWLAMPPHPPASPPAGPFDSRPLPRLPAAPRAWQPCRSPVGLLACPAALPLTSTAARMPAGKGAAPCKILELLLHHGWVEAGNGFAESCLQVGRAFLILKRATGRA